MTNPAPERILHILQSLSCNSGISNVVLNWHRHIDKSRFQFDYLLFADCPAYESLAQEVFALGGRVYQVPYQGLPYAWRFVQGVRGFFKQHPYRIIHSHVTHLNCVYYPIARLYGAKEIIQHAHSTRWSARLGAAIRNYILLHSVWKYIDHPLACSEAAGRFMFGKKYTVILNGIDRQQFSFNANVRERVRKELGLTDKFIIGHVGRFSKEKNHTFLLECFAHVAKKREDAFLLLVGDGPLLPEIQRRVHSLNLQDKVKFLGLQTACARFYQAMDLFVLPSTQEGLPVVGLEAQAVGLPCLFSDAITTEALCGKTRVMPLAAGPRSWAEIILSWTQFAKKTKDKGRIEQFDIRQTTRQLEQFYLNLSH